MTEASDQKGTRWPISSNSISSTWPIDRTIITLKTVLERGIMFPVQFTFIFDLVYAFYITPVQSNWSWKNYANDISQNSFTFFGKSACRPECRSMRMCSADWRTDLSHRTLFKQMRRFSGSLCTKQIITLRPITIHHAACEWLCVRVSVCVCVWMCSQFDALKTERQIRYVVL